MLCSAVVCLLLFTEFTIALEFEKCQQENGSDGVCISIVACPQAKQLLSNRMFPKPCGFKGKTPLVCCPLEWTRAKLKCAEYRYFDYDEESRVGGLGGVGGEDALAKEFPLMAALGYGPENDIKWYCGGTLISEQWILTAAHCLFHKEYGYVSKVRLGDLNLEITTDDADPQDFKVLERVPHPDYKPSLRYHDIALIKIDKPATITKYVQPGCLDVDNNGNESVPVATGWGLLSFAGDSSPHLQKLNLDFFNHQECKQVYSSSDRALPQGIIDDLQVCAGGKDRVQDTCQGDSGGPLLIMHKTLIVRHFVVAGVTSFGKGCGIPNIPAVYTRVLKYVPWIEDIVWPSYRM